MRKTRSMTRLTLARRLSELAVRIAAGKPVRIAGTAVSLPERFALEEELETSGGETELELELKWPAAPGRAKGGRGRRGR